jgi:hypothetical protein
LGGFVLTCTSFIYCSDAKPREVYTTCSTPLIHTGLYLKKQWFYLSDQYSALSKPGYLSGLSYLEIAKKAHEQNP